MNNAAAPSIIFQHPTNNVNVYPNPTSDQITIDIKGYNGNVNVYDLQGRLLEATTRPKYLVKNTKEEFTSSK